MPPPSWSESFPGSCIGLEDTSTWEGVGSKETVSCSLGLFNCDWGACISSSLL